MVVIVVILGYGALKHTHTHTHYIKRENMFLCFGLSSSSINNKMFGSPFFFLPLPLSFIACATPMTMFFRGGASIKMHQQQQRKRSVFIYFAASS